MFLLASVVLGYEPDGFEHMYELGKESYLEENWGYCAKFMEEAVRDYNTYRVRFLTISSHCHLHIFVLFLSCSFVSHKNARSLSRNAGGIASVRRRGSNP